MNREEPELWIERRMDTHELLIWYREARGSKDVYIGYDGKKLVEHVVDPLKCGDFTKSKDKITPLMRLPLRFGENMLPMLVEEMNRNGIQPKQQYVNDGKLEAMSEHLSDMKKIAFKGLKIDQNG